MVRPLPTAVSALFVGYDVLNDLGNITKHEDPNSTKTVKEQVAEMMTELDEAIAARDQDKVRTIAFHGRQIVSTAKKWNQFGLEQAQKEYQTAQEASQLNNALDTKTALDEAANEVKLWSDSLEGLDDDQLEVNERINAKVASMNTPDTTTADTKSTLVPVIPLEQVETKPEPERVSERSVELLELITNIKELTAAHQSRIDILRREHDQAKADFSAALNNGTVDSNEEKIKSIKTEAGIPIPQ